MLKPEESFAPSPTSRWLVSTDWLAEHLRDRNLVVVDASYFLPTIKRDAGAEYRAHHIPGAVFFDIDAVSDHSTELPHMLPGTTQFGDAVGALGIGDGDTIVVYDSAGLYSAARVWWTFRIFGAKKVYILDGGLPKWQAENRPLEQGDSKRTPKKFTAEMNVRAVALLDDVRMALADDSAQVVDARSAERFAGKAPEPRPGLRSGHMPRAFNVPYGKLIENGRARESKRRSRRPASTSTSRSSPRAAPASPPRSSLSRWSPSAKNQKAFTTARGRNGARASICRSSTINPQAPGARDPRAGALYWRLQSREPADAFTQTELRVLRSRSAAGFV
jgi:thiosulfate/3-mercaptopyruvate sulfurtransferase